MARADLPVQAVSRAGLKPTYEPAVADGHMIANDGRAVLHVKNGGSSAVTVTVVTPATFGGLAVADLTVSVPAGEERLIGRFAPTVFNQPTGSADAGKVHVDYSAVTSVTVAALSL